MFNKPNKELQHLNDELLAEEEDWLEEEYEEEEEYGDDLDLEDLEELLGDDEDEDFEEEDFEEVPVYRNHANRYGRGNPKAFDYEEYDDHDLEDEEFLYRDDYRKAKKKKKRGNIGLVILAIVEFIAIAAIALWWASWLL